MIQTATTMLDVDGRRFPLVHPAGHSVEYMLTELFRKQVYPPLPFLAQCMRVIFDIGANIGCASILFRLHYPQAKIYAFEPDPTAFHCLRANLGTIADLQLYNFGFYSHACRANLYQGNNNTTTNSISASFHNTAERVEVELRRLSAFIEENQVEHISLLKLDTEGGELPILNDIESDLGKVDAIQLEYHSESDRREIDRLMERRFVLVGAHVELPHRGTLSYVAQELVSELTTLDRLRIPRPQI